MTKHWKNRFSIATHREKTTPMTRDRHRHGREPKNPQMSFGGSLKAQIGKRRRTPYQAPQALERRIPIMFGFENQQDPTSRVLTISGASYLELRHRRLSSYPKELTTNSPAEIQHRNSSVKTTYSLWEEACAGRSGIFGRFFQEQRVGRYHFLSLLQSLDTKMSAGINTSGASSS